jgi:DNA-binding NarL/FixJ family response regulator
MLTTNKFKFFIVDDDPFCRSLYQQHLVNLGFKNNILFENGHDCLEMLDLAPDIIFMDYDMQPMNGIEVLKKIKKRYPNINLFIISSHSSEEVVREALKCGAEDFIPKGDNDLELISKVIRKIDCKKKYAE